ncbi:MAG: peptidoglycan DD-metalloendopeptidase family protein [Candidatus Magasanikbacteria bacterium]|nr:peptidoglycan DD-metalloendopeptidase family protein [Candidatus Magasanikbacteria bacterium]
MKKYQVLLLILRGFIYLKRALWWGGRVLGKGAGVALWPVVKGVLWLKYKIFYRFKKSLASGLATVLWGRGLMQTALFGALFLVALPQTRLLAKTDPALAGRRTLAYTLIGLDDKSEIQEVTLAEIPLAPVPANRRIGSLESQRVSGADAAFNYEELAMSAVAGGSALLKPIMLPGAISVSLTARQTTINYEVNPGDSLNLIAARFNIKLATILWENGLTERTLIRPGLILKIPPVDGVMHTVKKGDTIQKIAKLYTAKVDDIIAFNNLNQKATNLIIGDRVMIPGGVKKVSGVPLATKGRTTGSAAVRAAPPRSLSGPSASGFIWPSGARMITQYYSWKHHALDVAGSWQTPNYAAKAGTVEKAQCGWNSGYGCMIIIDHGGGVKTLYGHNSVLLVSPGDYVDAGQTIGLMGNTGKVRGKTGIHLHFEIIINGVRRNPLGYVR